MTKERAAKDLNKATRGLAARKLATEILIAVETREAYANLAIEAAFQRKVLSERDRAFVTYIVHGVLRHYLRIDERLTHLIDRPLAKMPLTLRNALRVAIFQIDYMPDIPPSAAINTCVDFVKRYGHVGQSKFANGVLRNCLRSRNQFESNLLTNAEQLSSRYSMPVWLIEKWLNNWGSDEAICLLEHSQMIPKLVLRTCELSVTVEALEKLLQDKGIKVRRGMLVESCLIVEDKGAFKGRPDKLPGYADGLFSIQDEAAAFAAKVVNAKPGELVVDLCAAPGGKTMYLAEMMNNKGRVVAVDSHRGRLNLLSETRQRLGLTNIEIFNADGRSFLLDTKAHRVLVDVPCSGTGVIGRRSDIRLNRTAPDVVQLVAIQRQLLQSASALVAPGGVLVYATCSIEPEENQENVRWFLNNNEQFVPSSLEPYVPDDLLKDWQSGKIINLNEPWLTLLPSRHNTSGFFVCRLRRKGD